MKLFKAGIASGLFTLGNCCFPTLTSEIDDFGDKYKVMPDDVRDSLNHVIEYFTSSGEGNMLMDSVMPGYGEDEEEEGSDFDASRTLGIILNPMENTNRFLRYEFMKEKNGITDAESERNGRNCDFGWKNIDGLCWKMIRDDMTKLDAKQNCMIKNAELVKPDNKRDNRNIADFMWAEEAKSCVWLGINDEKREGQFYYDNTNERVGYYEFARYARMNDVTRNNVYFTGTSVYKPKMRRWNMASQGKKCNSICVKAPGDRNRTPNAVSDPLSNVNRFVTTGELDEFYALVEKKLKNGERMCEEGWTEVGTGCYKFVNEVMDKKSHKKNCLTFGASLVKINSEEDNDELLGFLDQNNFGSEGLSDDIWLGVNDGKEEGTWVFDNSRPPIFVDWTNFDADSNPNDEINNSARLRHSSGTWFRGTALDQATAVCAKPMLPTA